jgi:glucosamine kinase
MTIWVGIDGGGTNLRVAVVDTALVALGEAQRGTANPSTIGREAATALVQEALAEALQQAGKSPEDVAGVGVGIAGASADHSEDWLREIIGTALPGAHIAPSSDNEIALVGAHGQRCGLLVLAGTGSVAYGVNRAGTSAQAGGWGYLLGDEGSGYWIGTAALRLMICCADGRQTAQSARLLERLAAELALRTPRDVIPWLYGSPTPRTRDVAGLARLVLDEAAAGEPHAVEIVTTAASDLATLCRAVSNRLGDETLPVAFAGGLLQQPNPLSNSLRVLLRLPAHPVPRYPPVIGAALLAQLTMKEQK